MRRGRILVVDDDEVILLIAQNELARAGFYTEVVFSGPDAKGLIEENPFDIVFTDLILSGTDGVTLCGEIKKISPKTKVVLMSAYSGAMEDQMQAFLNAGGYSEFLKKPISKGQLTGIAEKILSETEEIVS